MAVTIAVDSCFVGGRGERHRGKEEGAGKDPSEQHRRSPSLFPHRHCGRSDVGVVVAATVGVQFGGSLKIQIEPRSSQTLD